MRELIAERLRLYDALYGDLASGWNWTKEARAMHLLGADADRFRNLGARCRSVTHGEEEEHD
jgi:hypothetical protein